MAKKTKTQKPKISDAIGVVVRRIKAGLDEVSAVERLERIFDEAFDEKTNPSIAALRAAHAVEIQKFQDALDGANAIIAERAEELERKSGVLDGAIETIEKLQADLKAEESDRMDAEEERDALEIERDEAVQGEINAKEKMKEKIAEFDKVILDLRQTIREKDVAIRLSEESGKMDREIAETAVKQKEAAEKKAEIMANKKEADIQRIRMLEREKDMSAGKLRVMSGKYQKLRELVLKCKGGKKLLELAGEK